jgi:hypothetical protein
MHKKTTPKHAVKKKVQRVDGESRHGKISPNATIREPKPFGSEKKK